MTIDTLEPKLMKLIRIGKSKLVTPTTLLFILLVLVILAAMAGYIMGQRREAGYNAKAVLHDSVTQTEIVITDDLRASPQDVRITSGSIVRWVNQTENPIEVAITAHDYGEAFNQTLVIDPGVKAHHTFYDKGSFSYYLTSTSAPQAIQTAAHAITVD